MTNPLQIALSVRSDFSLGESSLQIKKLVARATELNYKTLALVDTMSVSSMPKFSGACKKAGIKPITGCTLRVVDDPAARVKDRENGGFRLKVYVKSNRGLQSLYGLLTKALQPDHFYYHSRCSLAEVLALEDVVVTTGDLHSVFHREDHPTLVAQLRERFAADFYVEVVAMATPLWDRLNTRAMATEGPHFVSRPVFYETPEDADSTDVLRAISSNTQTDSIFLARPYVRNMALLAPKDHFDHAQALGRTLGHGMGAALRANAEIADKCLYEFKKLEPCLPKMADDEFAALCAAVREGWAIRFGAPVWGHLPDDFAVYKTRLSFELGVLKKMGFSGYFLLVHDIVNWAKSNGVRVGPGRGSAAGSLVSYLMGITDLDPVRFDLLFERFINPDRIDLPDADLDFESGKRHLVVDYITKKWGAEHVAGIVNYSTLGAASALRDSARLHGLLPYEYACSKQMESEHGVTLGLEESAAKVPDIEKFKLERPIIWNHAIRLEGANRTLSQHAAGVVVAGEPIVNRAVVSTQSGASVIQWDKSQVEEFGLIKMDILGLTTLDVIESTLAYIQERHFKRIDTLRLPLDDTKTLAAFGKGDTVGVFQFSGAGMRKLLREMAMCEGGITFADACAATALFRPGPLDAGLCDRYVQVKQGATKVFYDHPSLEECLGDTFGVLVYQEQVMKLCRVLCGFTPGEADGVRKAIGKKDHEKMAEYGDKFKAGAAVSGMSEYKAEELWQTILGFAGYAFNKSHAYAYTLLSYTTMWLKVHYPLEFFAGALSTVEKEDQQANLITDAQSRGIRVLPPDVNHSSDRIEIKGDEELYAPLQAVKGISSNVAAAIMALRAARTTPFTSLDDFDGKIQKEVLGRTKVNTAHRAALDRVGGFYSITGGVPPTHPDRLRDRLALMPGFTVEMVKADRKLTVEHLAKIQITRLIEETRTCEGCSLKGKPHPVPRLGEAPKFMLVFDTPSFLDEKAGKMLAPAHDGMGSAEVIQAALKGVGLKTGDGYYTALVKATKDKGKKDLTNEMINGCSKFLLQEIDILKPPVIVAMGANAIRFFAPGIKGSPGDLAGKAIYRSDLDATIIFGLNPASLFFDPGKITLIEATFTKLGDLLS